MAEKKARPLESICSDLDGALRRYEEFKEKARESSRANTEACNGASRELKEIGQLRAEMDNALDVRTK
jgi:hypothetical protein